MVLCEFTMSPLGKGESVSAYVARVLNIIDKSGISYRLTPMSTILEGEWDEVMNVIRACHEELSSDCNRITASIKIDSRAGTNGRIDSKVEKLEHLLGKTLR